jgi:hypothetical protein
MYRIREVQKMKLYEIEQAILECVDGDTGEIIDVDRLNQLAIDKRTKIDNIISWYKQLAAEVTAIENEVKALKERQNHKITKSESLKQWLGDVLNGSIFESSRNFVSWRKSDEVYIFDEAKVPDEYKDEKIETCISKSDIKKAIKNNIDVAGAVLIYKNNIQIK